MKLDLIVARQAGGGGGGWFGEPGFLELVELLRAFLAEQFRDGTLGAKGHRTATLTGGGFAAGVEVKPTAVQ